MGLVLFALLTTVTSPAEVNWTYIGEERLSSAEKDPSNWLMVNRGYDSKRYSPLAQITTKNVNNLVPKWTFSLGGRGRQESTPIVNNGVMIVTSASSKLHALDARTGTLLWKREADLPDDLRRFLCCGAVNRGAAVLGDTVYYVTADAHLLAVDARTGKVIWDVKLEDYRAGYTSTGVPLVAKGKVVIGIAGGEFGIRGFLQAFNAQTGQSLWKTYTIPAPGEPGSETWPPDSDIWQHGGGPTHGTGSYDPELNVIYWGTGNPAPVFNGDIRPGDNLYTSGVLALDADTGKIKWFYQWTPHDVYDYDGVNEMVLVDNIKRPDGTIIEKGLIHADKNGHFYLLDRVRGKIVYARPFVHVDSITVDPSTGKVTPLKWAKPGEPVVACPRGGKDWHPMSYHPGTGMAYLGAEEMCVRYIRLRMSYQKGPRFGGGTHEWLQPSGGHLMAIEVASGRTAWKYETDLPMRTGILTTAGGLLFAASPNGELMALDAMTGKVIWSSQTGSTIEAPPMTFAIDGKQYLAVVSQGSNKHSPASRGGPPSPPKVLVFGLRDESKTQSK